MISFLQSFSTKPLNAFLFSQMWAIRLPWIYHPNNIWRITKITKLVITLFLTVSCYYFHFVPNDLPQNSILVHPQPIKIKLFYEEAAVIGHNQRSRNNLSSNEIVTISCFLPFCYSVNGNLPSDIKDVRLLYTTLLNTTSTSVADGTNSCLLAIVTQAETTSNHSV